MLHPEYETIRSDLERIRDQRLRSIQDLYFQLRRTADPAKHEMEMHAHVKELHRIIEALDGIRSGHYGICATCHAPIPRDELRADPTARRCVFCQDPARAETRTHGQ